MCSRLRKVADAVIASSRLRDWGLLLFCNLIWGSQFVLLKVVQREMGPLFATFFPLALSTLVMVPLASRDRRRRGENPGRMPGGDVARFVLLGAVGQFLVLFFSAWGVRLTLASNAALVALSHPVLIAVMAYFLLGERMTRIRLLSFGLAIAGVLECSGVNLQGVSLAKPQFLTGNLLCLLSVSGSAFKMTYSKKLLARYSPLQVVLYMYAAASIIMLPITLYFERESFWNLLHFSGRVWAGLIFLALIRNTLAQVLLLKILSRLDATVTGLSTYIIPCFGVLTSCIFLHERLTEYMVLGGMLVLAGTLLITVSEGRKRGRALASPAQVSG